jgi:hypothetical protein
LFRAIVIRILTFEVQGAGIQVAHVDEHGVG